jgi:uncharacterized protein
VSIDQQTTSADEIQMQSAVDGDMIVEWDVPIEMDDGIILRADVFRPKAPGRYPVLLSHGPYGKGLTWTTGVYEGQWKLLTTEHPDVLEGSTGKYQSWETVDPERWVPWDYVCVRIDSRGAGRSPGFLDPQQPREIQDFYTCIEWAGVQDWSNGKVGLAGISYYATTQWLVAGLKPPHLAAICPWEGFSDWYRDCVYNGGIHSVFAQNWFERQVTSLQFGLGERGARNELNGELVSGPPSLTDDELRENRAAFRRVMLDHPLYDEYWDARAAKWDQIDVPLLSAANWGGQPMHPRGNYAGFLEAASTQKWLECHGLEHWTHFYTDYGVQLQKQFFDHFLKGDDNGWDKKAPVQLQVRHVDKFVPRDEQEWPLARTEWTKIYLDVDNRKLSWNPPASEASASFEAMEDKLVFLSDPFEQEMEITGPLVSKLHVASSTEDADLFLVLHLFDPNGDEITFAGTLDPHTPVGQGWLRASQRAIDPERSKPWQPFRPHDRVEPLEPGKTYALDVEIIPTCIVVPVGYRLGFTVRGTDYEFEGDLGDRGVNLGTFANQMRGCGPFLHNDPEGRRADLYGGVTTVTSSPAEPSYVVLPIIPSA